ncbi:MAG TPA: TolC family protein, partial [Gemmataceae bacterium]|nr:TolC family protein [Gemmataceae bacterium]
MAWTRWHRCAVLACLVAGAAWLSLTAAAQDALPQPTPLQTTTASPMPAAGVPALPPGFKALPINLPTALQLANARPIDVAVATQRIRQAAAQLEQAQVLWLPTIDVGIDYYHHDGRIQDTAGTVSDNSHGGFMVGAGPYAVFALSDAIFQPLAARQDVRARQAALQTARNDSLLAVSQAYFNVQQARGELAGAEEIARRINQLVERTRGLVASGVVPELEVFRARAAAATANQALQRARADWRVASADLVRVLRLDPAAVVEPLEPPQLRVDLVALERPVDDLIRLALTNRPELASQQALVQATLERLRQEKLRPLIPSLLLRGFSTPVTGTLAGGLYGGGVNDNVGNFGARSDFDIQLLWQLQNLGFGNRALVHQRQAENQQAVLELFRTEDRVAAEVAQAYAQAQTAAQRIKDATEELQAAAESANKNVQGLGQSKLAGNVLILLVRPQEVVAALQALGQSYADYYTAVADYDRAQFRLYHALGQPAQALAPTTT